MRNLSGTLPNDLSQLNALTRLDLNRNLIVGTVPTSLFQLTNLRILSLWGNADLSGTFPALIGLLPRLTELRLGSCRLSGTLPSQIALLTELRDFHVVLNNFTGPLDILTSLRQLTSLRVELQAGDGFAASIPDRFNTIRDCTAAFNDSDRSCYTQCPPLCCRNGFRRCPAISGGGAVTTVTAQLVTGQTSTISTTSASMTTFMSMSIMTSMVSNSFSSSSSSSSLLSSSSSSQSFLPSNFDAMMSLERESDSSDMTILIAGVCGGVVLAICLIVAIVFVLKRPIARAAAQRTNVEAVVTVEAIEHQQQQRHLEDDDNKSCVTDDTASNYTRSTGGADPNYGVIPTSTGSHIPPEYAVGDFNTLH